MADKRYRKKNGGWQGLYGAGSEQEKKLFSSGKPRDSLDLFGPNFKVPNKPYKDWSVEERLNVRRWEDGLAERRQTVQVKPEQKEVVKKVRTPSTMEQLSVLSEDITVVRAQITWCQQNGADSTAAKVRLSRKTKEFNKLWYLHLEEK